MESNLTDERLSELIQHGEFFGRETKPDVAAALRELRSLRATCARLSDALRPFAETAKQIFPTGNENDLYFYRGDAKLPKIRDYRAALAAFWQAARDVNLETQP